MTDQMQRFRTLVEAEGKVREELVFDRQTSQSLRERLDDLLESITSYARDDDLWQGLADAAAEPLTASQFDMLTELVAGDLASLLETFGYRCPPMPPVNELVDTTIDALVAAIRAKEDRRELILAARWHLVTFDMRVRRQIEEAPLSAAPSTLRRVARRAVRLHGN